MKKKLATFALAVACLAAILTLPTLAYNLMYSSEPAKEPVTEVVYKEPKPPTASEIISLVNDERRKRNIAPLGSYATLNQSAKAKAKDLVEYRYFEHVNPHTGVNGATFAFDILRRDQCMNIGENLAQGTTSSKETIEAWLGSPSHRDAMLSPKYELTGVAVVKDYRSGGGYIAVQHFCDVE